VSALDDERRSLARHAAVLFLLSALTGAYAGLAMTGKIPVDGHSALTAHTNALLSTFWLLGLAWSLRFVALGRGARVALCRAALISAYANWSITAVKAALNVRGLEIEPGQVANNVVNAALLFFVIFPTFIAAVLWVYGLRPGATPAAE
jgi:hypothetical protein